MSTATAPTYNSGSHLTIEYIAQCLGNGREEQTRDGWKTLCPCHGDTEPSLDINKGNSVAMLVKCQANCDQAQVEATLKSMNLWIYPQRSEWSPPGLELVKAYSYRNAQDVEVYQSVRFWDTAKNKKTFLQRRMVDGAWTYKGVLNGIQRYPYNLPEVLKAAKKGDRVVIQEGEQDCDSLREYGIASSTNSGGAGKWDERFAEYFRGAEVYIIPDNDKAGFEHVKSVCMSFYKAGIPIRVVELPGAGQKEDLGDWIKSGCSYEMLEQLMSEAEIWKPHVDEQIDFEAPAEEEIDMTPPVEQQQLRLVDNVVTLEIPAEEHELYQDTANALRFIKQHGANVRYADGCWLIWSGKQWKIDDLDEIEELAEQTARLISQEKCPPNIDVKKHKKWVQDSLNHTRKLSMLRSARTKVLCRMSDFDADPYLLNFTNGVVDLRTMELHPHDQKYMCSKIINYNYNPDAECETWLKFLLKAQKNDWEMVEFIQRVIGFVLTGTGTQVEQHWMFVYGPPSTGKTKLFNTILKITGEYGTNVSSNMFMVRTQENSQYNPIHLEGKRFIGVNEVGQHDKFDEKFLKSFTGGNEIDGRRLYSKFNTHYMPVGTVMMQSNHRPTVGSDKGFWRRILIIPFVVQVLGEDRDLELEEKFDEEIEGILAWAVRGAHEWCEKRLSPPAKVLLATEAYEDDMDYMSEFFLERCEIEESLECLEDDIYKDFSDWATRKGFPVLKRRAFREELNRNGFKRTAVLKAFKWCGIGLNAPPPTTQNFWEKD